MEACRGFLWCYHMSILANLWARHRRDKKCDEWRQATERRVRLRRARRDVAENRQVASELKRLYNSAYRRFHDWLVPRCALKH
jgi:hypothetical protein